MFSINELIYDVHRQEAETSEQSFGDYGEILTKIRQSISQHHSADLAAMLDSPAAEKRLKTLIMRYLNSLGLVASDMGNIALLVDKLYNDMAGLSILTDYLRDPDLEELNINGHNGIWLTYGEKKELLPYTFNNVGECVNIVKKMSRLGNVILDGSKPYGDSYIAKGMRMSGVIAPCVDNEMGGAASIRKQKPAVITRDLLLENETATEIELQFLSLCINCGVSVGISGNTGSGKTADIGYLLSTIADDKRIITIEDTKELNLARFNENGQMLNDVLQFYTMEEPNPVTMLDLLKISLRFNPDILVPAEMRGKEALTVVEAGRTGHTIVSTMHANSAAAAYIRILTMCQEAGTTLSEDRLLKNIVDAFPIMLFKKQLEDKSRKYMELIEVTGVENGTLKYHTLFKFRVTGHQRDSNRKIIKTLGKHEQIGYISEELAERLLVNGAEQSELEKFLGGGGIA